jgi:RNA polymerase sigma-70 factor (ECF subfamily)
MESTDDPLPTRRSLVTRLKHWDDQEAWQRFFDSYWRLIYEVARRSGLADAEAQDVVQDTVIAVAKQMPTFRYDPAVGSFKSWLRLITRRRVADHLRKRGRQPAVVEPVPGDEERTSLIERVPEPGPGAFDRLWDEEWQRRLFDQALKRVKQRVDARQFQIFDCYVLKQWSVEDVARVLKVTAGQVYLAKHRLAALLKDEVGRLEAGTP